MKTETGDLKGRNRNDTTTDLAPDLALDLAPNLVPNHVPDLVPDFTPDFASDLVSDSTPDLVPDLLPVAIGEGVVGPEHLPHSTSHDPVSGMGLGSKTFLDPLIGHVRKPWKNHAPRTTINVPTRLSDAHQCHILTRSNFLKRRA